MKLANKKHLIVISILIISLGLLSALIFLVYRPVASEQNVSFSEPFELKLNQTATFADGNESVGFKFTGISPPTESTCSNDINEGICVDGSPYIEAELTYLGRTFITRTYSENGDMDIDSETKSGSKEYLDHDNSAISLIPYNIELVSVNFDNLTAKAKITKKNFKKVELGQEFVLEHDTISVLVPGKTGVHIEYGQCRGEKPCIGRMEFYVDNKYFVHKKTVESGSSAGKPTYTDLTTYVDELIVDQGYAEGDGVRLRLVKDGSETNAKFVFEAVE